MAIYSQTLQTLHIYLDVTAEFSQTCEIFVGNIWLNFQQFVYISSYYML